MARSFIDETIQSLDNSSNEIKRIWNLFKTGEITKDTFEQEYKQVLSGWLSEVIGEERYTPNNGCKYKESNPEVTNFKTLDI